MIEKLNRLGDRMLARLLPRMNASACQCAPDPWQECDWISVSACAVYYGRGVLFNCSYNCACAVYCTQTRCC
jgi:hypothetical protein